MRTDFKPGTLVKWKIEGGAYGRLVKYLKEDFYLVETVPGGRALAAHQDDLELAPKEENDAAETRAS